MTDGESNNPKPLDPWKFFGEQPDTGSADSLTEGEKKAIVGMFAHGTGVRDLAEWYEVDQATIREVLKPHVKFAIESSKDE
jgi:hypothetical protein